ncbi:MAG: hypothetical protein H6625_09925 [Bdellovibrionaceae bacterium]|nr:hypothetical protein [Pseudobdellovibrionaceae bacterium]
MKKLLILICFTPYWSLAQNSLPYLLKPLNQLSSLSQDYSGETLQRKTKLSERAQLQTLQFSQLDQPPSRVWNQERFILPLENSVEIIVKVQKKYWDDRGHIHLTGKVQGDYYGRAHLISTTQGISGTISAGGKEYNLMPLGDKLHAVYSYEESEGQSYQHSKALDSLREKMKKEKVGVHQDSSKEIHLNATSDNFIDVLVVYTDDVAAASTDPEAVIESHMDYTNQALEDSCANYRMRIVHQAQVNYTESASAVADLNCVTTPGHADCAGNDLSIVPTLRATHGADLVQFVTNTSDYCGLAWVGAEPFTANYGYSQKLFLCAGATMAHELGHNMGLGHDRYQTGFGPRDSSTYGAGHGYVDLVNYTRTIMSYDDQCTALGVSCLRVGIYSNPKIRKQGQAQGDFGFTDATSRINETYKSVANFNSPATSYAVSINESCVSSSESDKDVHCFIATAAYGSYLHSHVVKLKAFRDQFLKSTYLGRKFIKIYYKYSPEMAFYISQKPLLKKITRWILTPFVFAVAYPSSGILVILGLLFFFLAYRKKKVIYLIPLFCFYPLDYTQAQVAQPSLFDNQLTINPAALYAPFRSSYIGYTQNVVKGEASSNLSKLEVSGSRGQTNAALMWGSGGFAIQYQPESSLNYKTTIGTSPSFTDKYSEAITTVNLAFAILESTDFGFKFGQEKFIINQENSILPTEVERSKFGLGLRMKFGEWFYVGASADHVTEKGTSNPETKWIEASMGLGFSQRMDGDAWLVELSATRGPQILNQNSGNVTSYGEKLNLGLILEKEFSMSDSMFNTMTLGALYKTISEKEFQPYLDEEQKISITGVNMGIKTLNKSVNLTASYEIQQMHFGDERKDDRISLTLMYNIAGSIFL